MSHDPHLSKMAFAFIRVAPRPSKPRDAGLTIVADRGMAMHRLADLIEEFKAVRGATLALFRNMRAGDWTRQGVANKNEITVRALAYIIAGHELHHRNIIEERYFGGQARAEIA